MAVKIGIIGAGHLGKALAVLLSSSGYDVEIAVKKNSGVQIDKKYLYEIIGDFGERSCLIPTVNSIENFTSKKDIIICAVRNYDLKRTAKSALDYIESNGTIVTIHNVFAVNDIMRIVPDNKSVCMFCNFACTSVGNKIYISNSNGISLGVYNKDAISRLKVLTKIFREYCNVDNIKDVFGLGISRTIINNAISAVGAITGEDLGECLSNKKCRCLFYYLIEETVNVIKRYRIKILPYNNQLDYYKFTDNSFSGKKYRLRIIRLLKNQNGFIRSSALIDFERGKKPELIYLLESFLIFAKKSRVDIKYITRVYNMLVDIYNGKIRIDDDNVDILMKN